jgi:hypothetical protein
MAVTPQNQYDIPQGGYVAFDALSLRQIIIDRLNAQGTFTDQNYVGSNLASVIDIIAYSYNTLIYYLNKTSTESMFSESQLYENMNRIVKLIDYKPIGFQTSTLSISAFAQNLPVGVYTIPRYTYTTVANIPYTFNQDVTFAKTVNNTIEPLTNLSQNVFLYQGKFQEYPVYTASGNSNEVVTISLNGGTADHFNFNVYVYSQKDGRWYQYTPVESLYLSTGTALNYQIRLNEKQDYEITFGNDINGRKLQTGDLVAVYYLLSNGAAGQVGPYAFRGNTTFNLFNTTQYNNILTDVVGDQYNFLLQPQLVNTLVLQNNTSSTVSVSAQNVDVIRNYAPVNFRSQYRLVTTQDYNTFIKTNYSNFIADVNVINNTDYVAKYLSYFYSLGINNPSLTNRALVNQVLYSDSCNFNNIYIIAVPLNIQGATTGYLTPSQKQLIKTDTEQYCTTTSEVTFVDPVYKAVTFGVNTPGAVFDPAQDINNIQLQIVKTPNTQYSNSVIISNVANIIKNYFNTGKSGLGQIIDVRTLTQQILETPGVQNIYTTRTDGSGIRAEGLSVYIWNTNYPTQDVTVTTNNVTLEIFEYPYFYNIGNIINNISIISE